MACGVEVQTVNRVRRNKVLSIEKRDAIRFCNSGVVDGKLKGLFAGLTEPGGEVRKGKAVAREVAVGGA